MSEIQIRKYPLVAFLIILIPLLAFPQIALAVTPAKKMVRKSGLTSERTHRRLKRAHTLIANKDTKSALEILQKLVKKTKAKPFEQAQAYQAIGYVYAQREDYKSSIQYFDKALKLERLPVSTTLSTMYTVAQLKISIEDYQNGVADLQSWFSYAENPSAEAYILLGMGYGELKQYSKAIKPVKLAISKSKAPKEQWFQFLLALYYDLNLYPEATATLEELVSRFPKNPKYWKQLSGMHLNQNLNQKATAVMDLAYKQGFVTEPTDIKNLAILLLDQGAPFKSAEVMEKALLSGKLKQTEKNWSMVANSWALAKELGQAVKAYGRAGVLSDTGESYIKQGQLFSEMEQWNESALALRKGISKGKIKNKGRVFLLIGIAKYHLKDTSGAVAAFSSAKKHKKSTKQAQVWLSYFGENLTDVSL